MTGAVVVLAVTQTSTAIAGVLDAPFFALKSRKDLDAATVVRFLESFRKLGRLEVVIEQVGPRPHDGSKRSFDFGDGYGQYKGIVIGLGLPSVLVAPGTWKKAMGLSAIKDYSRQRAMQLFPDAADPTQPERGLFSRKKDDGRAEALLLCIWRMTKSAPLVNAA